MKLFGVEVSVMNLAFCVIAVVSMLYALLITMHAADMCKVGCDLTCKTDDFHYEPGLCVCKCPAGTSELGDVFESDGSLQFP